MTAAPTSPAAPMMPNSAVIERAAHCSALIRVNYGINHRLQGRHFSHRNGSMRIRGDWNDDATHDKIKAIIRRRHPGWNITGWHLSNADTSHTQKPEERP